MSTFHSDAVVLAALAEAGGNKAAAARALGIRRDSLKDRLKRIKARGTAAPVSTQPAAPKPAPILSRLATAERRDERAEDLREIRAARDEARQLQEKLDFALAIQRAERSKYKIPTYADGGGQAIPMIVLSDLHMEEVVRPEQVPGANNEFNLEIGVQRLRKVFQHGQFMVDTVRNMAKVDTLCLAILGDLISGTIHPDLAETNELSPVQAALHAMEHLNSGIEYLLSHGDYKKIIVPCCHGNHGRTTEKMRSQTSAETSYEWMMYQMMKQTWKNEKRLEWHIADGYHQYVNLFGTTVRFHHGDAIAYGGGVGGITIPVRKAIANWNTIQRADLDVFGHHHTMMDGGDFISNGSLIGFGPYALKIKARFERPRQAFCLIDKKMGKTMSAEIFVE